MERSFEEGDYRQVLAERISLVKVVLAIANLFVIWLDKTVPVDESSSSLRLAFFIAGGFLAYMLLSWWVVLKHVIPLGLYQRLSPITDVIAVGSLILITDGYMSPFNLWFAIVVVSTGFSGSALIPVIGALSAITAQLMIATVPQAEPLDLSIFTVRTVFLLGFAVLIAILSNQLLAQAQALSAIDVFGRDAATAHEVGPVITRFQEYVKALVGAEAVEVEFDVDPIEDVNVVGIGIGAQPYGVCRITRQKRLGGDERRIIRVLGDRLCASLRRINLSNELVAAAARGERERYADELHDTHLQTLAAVDLHAEIAARQSTDRTVVEELKVIKETVRAAAKRTREFISSIEDQPRSGPEAIREIMDDRWPGGEVLISQDLQLTEGQWLVVRMLVQEGLNNARVHGAAKNARFELRSQDGELLASLECDGCSPGASVTFGYGLGRLETLARANRGTITLNSGVRGGSRLEARFPI